jgi:hypothetical protein
VVFLGFQFGLAQQFFQAGQGFDRAPGLRLAGSPVSGCGVGTGGVSCMLFDLPANINFEHFFKGAIAGRFQVALAASC